jgi:hypothetical protein
MVARDLGRRCGGAAAVRGLECVAAAMLGFGVLQLMGLHGERANVWSVAPAVNNSAGGANSSVGAARTATEPQQPSPLDAPRSGTDAVHASSDLVLRNNGQLGACSAEPLRLNRYGQCRARESHSGSTARPR